MMFGRHVQEVTEKRGTAYLFDKMKPYFENADYVTGNFENPVLKRAEDSYEKLEKQIHLHTDAEAVKALKKMNFTTVNLANNHMMDYGEEGLQDTLETFDRSEEHTSELQSRGHLVCRLLLEKKKTKKTTRQKESK